MYTPTEIQEDLGQAARKRRLAFGLRQSDVAAAAGVTLSTVRRFEDGRNVGFAAVVRVAVVLHAEEQLLQIFPLPAIHSMDELLRSQKIANRKRARRPR